MLQQTQVRTVIPYFKRFMTQFPTVEVLARADEEDVLALWSGLGYYRRAKHLYAAAQYVATECDGQFPSTLDGLVKMPGIGPSTAGAILAQGFKQRGVILDGNVKRVLARFHAIDGSLSESMTIKTLWDLAEQHTPANQVGEYVQGIMDLGATCCTQRNANCNVCPVKQKCKAHRKGQVESYPVQATRKVQKRRELQLALLVDSAGRVLLERQPAKGRWASLWLPPELHPGEEVRDLLTRLEIEETQLTQLPKAEAFTHTLSHIQFRVSVNVFDVAGTPMEDSPNPSLRWIDPASLENLGVAKLTQRVLERATQNESASEYN